MSAVLVDIDANKPILTSAQENYDDNGQRPILLKLQGCQYPLSTGQACQLKLDTRSIPSNQSYFGGLYIADATSRYTYVPVYINIQKSLEPQMVDISIGSDSGSTLFKNLT